MTAANFTLNTPILGSVLAIETDTANAAAVGAIHDYGCEALSAPERISVDARTRTVGELCNLLAASGEPGGNLSALSSALSPCAAMRLGLLDSDEDNDAPRPLTYHCTRW